MLPVQPRQIADGSANRKRLDVSKFADQLEFELHSTSFFASN
jgi:hypothetical protein